MSPSISVADMGNSTSTAPVKFADFKYPHPVGVQSTYFQNLLFGEDGFVTLLSLVGSSFKDSINHVVLSGSNSKMVRIYTGPIVTLMHYVQSFWDWAYVMPVRKSVRSVILFWNYASKRSVSVLLFTASPNPATVRVRGFVNACKELFETVFLASGHNQKTPATIEVKSAQWSGNDDSEGERVSVSTVLKATLRPTHYVKNNQTSQ